MKHCIIRIVTLFCDQGCLFESLEIYNVTSLKFCVLSYFDFKIVEPQTSNSVIYNTCYTMEHWNNRELHIYIYIDMYINLVICLYTGLHFHRYVWWIIKRNVTVKWTNLVSWVRREINFEKDQSKKYLEEMLAEGSIWKLS